MIRRDLAEEGDKRYLSREMLQRSDCDLYKVCILSPVSRLISFCLLSFESITYSGSGGYFCFRCIYV